MRSVADTHATQDLAALLDAVEAGETVVITRDGKPVARLVPEEESTPKPGLSDGWVDRFVERFSFDGDGKPFRRDDLYRGFGGE